MGNSESDMRLAYDNMELYVMKYAREKSSHKNDKKIIMEWIRKFEPTNKSEYWYTRNIILILLTYKLSFKLISRLLDIFSSYRYSADTTYRITDLFDEFMNKILSHNRDATYYYVYTRLQWYKHYIVNKQTLDRMLDYFPHRIVNNKFISALYIIKWLKTIQAKCKSTIFEKNIWRCINRFA